MPPRPRCRRPLAGLLLLAAARLSAQGSEPLDPKDPANYFDAMPVHRTAEPIRALLDEMHSTCTRIGQPCPAGAQLLRTIFRGSYRDELPDFVVELRRDDAGERLRARQPLLLFNRHTTPYLSGAQHVSVLVFAAEPVPMRVRLTTLREREVNPFSGMLGIVGLKSGPEAPVAEAGEERADLAWRRLSFEEEDALFIGSARVPIDSDVVARLTLIPDDYDKVSFQSITAHISNSRYSPAAFSVALGVTLDTADTRLGEQGGDPYFNGYALAKFYLPRRRPRLEVSPTRRRHLRSSTAVVVGTNVTNDAFQEIVVGLSLGHLIGRSGVIVAGNSIRGAAGGSDRDWRLLVGVDFTF